MSYYICCETCGGSVCDLPLVLDFGILQEAQMNTKLPLINQSFLD